MSNEMRGEDTILGTALARAIESQPIRSTPFERSRVAVRMTGGGRRSPLFPVLAAAAAIVLGLALGAALLGQRGGDPGGVATQPPASPGATASPAGSPGASPTTGPEGTDRIWVYFARDQLPPVGAFVTGNFEDGSVEDRITSRLAELRAAQGAEVPSGTTNVFGETRSSSTFGLDVTVSGDTAKVAFQLSEGWGVSGSAASQALLQQLVYTITEEPGIRRAHIVEQGKEEAVIDQLVVDAPLTREDVLPYEGVKTEERVALEDDPREADATTRIADDVAPGLTRFIIDLKATGTPPEGGFWSPALTAELLRHDDPATPGKWILRVDLPGVRDTQQGDQVRDASPVRLVRAASSPQGMSYALALDDARPWRVSLEPATAGTMRLIVDIGGHPQAISDSVAVYAPQPGDEVGRTFTVAGTARAFEAHVSWRIKDSGDREVATGFATASLGTSPVWGTFEAQVQVPQNVSGVVTLEVFWPSPRDGADVGTVAIPLRVR